MQSIIEFYQTLDYSLLFAQLTAQIISTIPTNYTVAENNRNIKIEHFENLVAMAAADGHMDDDEKEFLAEKAEEFGLNPEEIKEILNNPHELTFKVPTTQDEKEEQLSDAVFMAMIDGEIHEKEYAMCINFANKLGLSNTDVDEIIALAKRLSL